MLFDHLLKKERCDFLSNVLPIKINRGAFFVDGVIYLQNLLICHTLNAYQAVNCLRSINILDVETQVV